jgi:hypothetical protein
MPSRLDREKAKGNLKVILDRLHNDTDFALLRDYKKLFKKEIFLLRRSDVAAWLFMNYDRKEIPRAQNAEKQAGFRSGKTGASEEKPSAFTDIALPEEESKRLFISIGKNRRLFPREIITLIMSKSSAAREDIGVIRILDNYSFVQVRETRADEIIEALNGIRFRGRTLAVNYAKPKAEVSEQSDN